jgi:toxin ParE1/3/4
MGRIVQRPLALEDVGDAWWYIAFSSGSARADAWLDRLDETFRVLSEAPRIGRLRPEMMEGLRSFPSDKYIVFYFPLEDGIDIVRVLHGARDITFGYFDTEYATQ